MCLERRSIIPRIKHSIKGFSAVWYVLVMILARNWKVCYYDILTKSRMLSRKGNRCSWNLIWGVERFFDVRFSRSMEGPPHSITHFNRCSKRLIIAFSTCPSLVWCMYNFPTIVQLIKIHNRRKWESFVITLRKEILGERTLAPWPLYTWWQIYIGVPYVVYLVEKISKWHLRGRITVLTWRIAFARNRC